MNVDLVHPTAAFGPAVSSDENMMEVRVGTAPAALVEDDVPASDQTSVRFEDKAPLPTGYAVAARGWKPPTAVVKAKMQGIVVVAETCPLKMRGEAQRLRLGVPVGGAGIQVVAHHLEAAENEHFVAVHEEGVAGWQDSVVDNVSIGPVVCHLASALLAVAVVAVPVVVVVGDKSIDVVGGESALGDQIQHDQWIHRENSRGDQLVAQFAPYVIGFEVEIVGDN
ncbi:hypothetical protein HK102_003970 [Quaeritorhiza haematococci]|nr:hypothetical protein HK102_003970 [Quaeritorhiza haematococci]